LELQLVAIKRAFLLICICVGFVYAQALPANSPNPTNVIKFDFGKESKQYRGKSLTLALTQSFLLPGLGESYLNRPDRSKWFFSAEIVGWAALIFTHYYSEHQLNRLYSYANTHARTQGLKKSEADLQLLGEYRFRDRVSSVQPASESGVDYQHDIDLQNQTADTGELYWDWGSSYEYEGADPFYSYKDMLKNYRKAQIGWQISVGMLALNRLLSVLDVFHLYRSGNSNLTLSPIPASDPGLQLSVKF
jgi:hypothetical protein